MADLSRFSFGDVVLVPFPFTDQSDVKKRPAVVASSRAYNASRRDIVIMAITSQVRNPMGFGEAMIVDWQSAGLIKVSVLKPVFATIEQGLVLRIIWGARQGRRRNAAQDRERRDRVTGLGQRRSTCKAPSRPSS